MLLPLSDDNPRYSVPYVNYALIATNVLVFLLVLSSGSEEEVVRRYGMTPALLGHAPITLLTSMFLHGGWAHIIGNMWFLWIVGDNVEDALGHGGYLLAYLVGGVAADLMHYASLPTSTIPTVGASGAISAVMGLYVVIFPQNNIRLLFGLYWLFWRTFWARAFWVIGGWFAIQLFLAMLSAGGGGAGVAYWAHVGGFAVGAAIAVVIKTFYPNVDPNRRHGVTFVPRQTVRVRLLSKDGMPAAWPASPYEAMPHTLRPPAALISFNSPAEAERAIERELLVGNVPAAARIAQSFAVAFRDSPMDAQRELNLVQALVRREDYATAAMLLEHFLATQPGHPNAPEAKLALGLMYSRHLQQWDRARLLLGAAAVQHPVPERAAIAHEELAQLG